MQLSSLAAKTGLKKETVGAIAGSQADFKPARPHAPDHARVVSIPTGLAFQPRDGPTYMLRRVTLADSGLLAEFLQHLSERTRWLRFMTAQPHSPEVVMPRSPVWRRALRAT